MVTFPAIKIFRHRMMSVMALIHSSSKSVNLIRDSKRKSLVLPSLFVLYRYCIPIFGCHLRSVIAELDFVHQSYDQSGRLLFLTTYRWS